jgi:hypothetical protein
MGIYDDWVEKYPEENADKQFVNVEFVLKAIDKYAGLVSKTANGLVPKLPNEITTTKYLRQDGTWEEPPDTTYSEMSGTTLGLVRLNGSYTFTGVINVPTPELPS